MAISNNRPNIELDEISNEEVVSNIMQIPISELRGWSYRDDRIRHNSGKFFSIDGIHIRTNYRNTPEWDQPIINQPEIGFWDLS